MAAESMGPFGATSLRIMGASEYPDNGTLKSGLQWERDVENKRFVWLVKGVPMPSWFRAAAQRHEGYSAVSSDDMLREAPQERIA